MRYTRQAWQRDRRQINAELRAFLDRNPGHDPVNFLARRDAVDAEFRAQKRPELP